LEQSARAAHIDFAERLREKAHQTAAQFGEEITASSAQHLANLTERARVSINEAQTQIDGALAALSKSQEGVKAEWETHLQESARAAHSNFAERLREKAHQTAAQFGEE